MRFDATVTKERNREFLERRRAGETWAAIAKDAGISAARVRQIVSREEKQEARRQELQEAARHSEQPNPLLLEPKLRAMLVAVCDKVDFTPDDIEALEFSKASFLRAGLRSPDWRVLVKWMAMADKWPVAPHRMTVREWLEYDAARLEKSQKEKAPRPEAERDDGGISL